MRILGSILCLLLLCAQASAADKKLSPAEQQEAAKMARIDAVAKEAFTAADHNHNDVLSKVEFPDAEQFLEEGLLQLGNQGVLGQTKNGQPGQASMAKAAAAAPTNLYKKNRISLSEFQLFARALGAQADVAMARTAQLIKHSCSRCKSRGAATGRSTPARPSSSAPDAAHRARAQPSSLPFAHYRGAWLLAPDMAGRVRSLPCVVVARRLTASARHATVRSRQAQAPFVARSAA